MGMGAGTSSATLILVRVSSSSLGLIIFIFLKDFKYKRLVPTKEFLGFSIVVANDVTVFVSDLIF